MLILSSTITACVSVSEFASLVYINAGILGSSVGINISAISAGIQKYKSNIKKNKKKHDNTLLLGKDNSNAIEVKI